MDDCCRLPLSSRALAIHFSPFWAPVMQTTLRAVRRFFRNEAGASMAEYALLVAVIALVALAGAKVLGTNVNTQLNNAGTKIAAP